MNPAYQGPMFQYSKRLYCTYLGTYFNFIPCIIHVWQSIKGLCSQSCIGEEITRICPKFSSGVLRICAYQLAETPGRGLGTISTGYIIVPPGQN